MTNKLLPGTPITRTDGVTGITVASNDQTIAPGRLALEFEDGSRMIVPASLVTMDDRGAYRLDVDLSGTTAGQVEEVVIPVIEEQWAIAKEQVARGIVRVRKEIEAVEQTIDLDTTSEQISIERVEINRLLDGDDIPMPREEDGVLIIPLIEEVQVVETRLMLREEVHVTRHRTTTSTPEVVMLRREVVHIEREAADGTVTPIDPTGAIL
jgi:uncharacterized protein (TIGR02271 family)